MKKQEKNNLSFGDALNIILTENKSMRLPHWKKDVEIKVCKNDPKMTAPFLYVESRYGKVPWIPTQIELLSTQWEIV